MGDLNLFFPQWQGCGKKTLYLGGSAFRKGLKLKERLKEIKLVQGDKLTVKNGILGYDPILEQMTKVHDILEEKNPGSVFTVGGGCSVAVEALTYLNKKAEGNLSVVWIDAHADLFTPSDSPDGKYDNMALRAVLDDIDPALDALRFSKIDPSQITLMGTRDLAPEAEAYIEEKGIINITMEKFIRTDPKFWINALKDHVYIHIDLDVLDPGCFKYVLDPKEGGVQKDHIRTILGLIENEKNIAGLSVSGFAHTASEPIEDLKDIVAVGLWI